jgi:hypothetical protein
MPAKGLSLQSFATFSSNIQRACNHFTLLAPVSSPKAFPYPMLPAARPSHVAASIQEPGGTPRWIRRTNITMSGVSLMITMLAKHGARAFSAPLRHAGQAEHAQARPPTVG